MKKLTKSTLSLILVLCALLLSFTACENKDAEIKMTYLDAQDDDGKILSSEHSEYLRAVLDNSEWVRGVPKVRCSYQFELDRKIIKYSPDPSILSDEAKERYIVLTEEQQEYINSVIIGMQTDGQDDNLANKEQLTAEDIKEGMKYSEIVEILGTNGKDVGSGAIIYEWQISDEEYLYVWFASVTASDSKDPPYDLIASSVEIRKERLHLAPVD